MSNMHTVTHINISLLIHHGMAPLKKLCISCDLKQQL